MDSDSIPTKSGSSTCVINPDEFDRKVDAIVAASNEGLDTSHMTHELADEFGAIRTEVTRRFGKLSRRVPSASKIDVRLRRTNGDEAGAGADEVLETKRLYRGLYEILTEMPSSGEPSVALDSTIGEVAPGHFTEIRIKAVEPLKAMASSMAEAVKVVSRAYREHSLATDRFERTIGEIRNAHLIDLRLGLAPSKPSPFARAGDDVPASGTDLDKVAPWGRFRVRLPKYKNPKEAEQALARSVPLPEYPQALETVVDVTVRREGDTNGNSKREEGDR